MMSQLRFDVRDTKARHECRGYPMVDQTRRYLHRNMLRAGGNTNVLGANLRRPVRRVIEPQNMKSWRLIRITLPPSWLPYTSLSNLPCPV